MTPARLLPRPAPTHPAVLPSGPSSQVGTFKDNKSAPLHRWFQYPAGFSYRAVEHALDTFRVGREGRVYDPFAGTGTTLVVCKGRGIPSVGTEAHALVARIARAKVSWDVDLDALAREQARFLRRLPRGRELPPGRKREVPELLHKCYSPRNLARLFWLRDHLEEVPAELRPVFEVALIGTLRAASSAATGWPYIAPRKRIRESEAFETFGRMLGRCVEDLSQTPRSYRQVPALVLEADARDPPADVDSIDLAFTSPPYLNNYDYADRMRLETYFLGWAGTWGEISQRFRSRLIVAATTQVGPQQASPAELVQRTVGAVAPAVSRRLVSAVEEMGRRRRLRPGNKSYDRMTAGYFADMTRALAATRDRLRARGRFVLILGDSAPYGVPIPTEEFLGQIGQGLGFRSYRVAPLRTRGAKWRSNPQRHHVPLKESWLVLER